MYGENIVYKSWVDNPLQIVEPSELNGEKGFRKPQRAALFATLGHLTTSPSIPATVVMPTGTGKTDTIFALIVSGFFRRTLIVVPSDALRTQTHTNVKELANLRRLDAIGEKTKSPEVFAMTGALSEENIKNIHKYNIVISTPQALALTDDQTMMLLVEACSHLVIDEAHHVAAKTWKSIKKAFGDKPCIQFTATPFREDKQALDGRIIYNYSLKDAQLDGYFQAIEFHPVREYQASCADSAIAEKAVMLLRTDLEGGKDHIMIARTNSITKAKQIFSLYESHQDLSPILVYSTVKNKEKIVASIKAKAHRIIVCVDMLGEGFDLPELKIAAIHDQHCSPAVTLQFIGRLTRTSERLGTAKFVANIANQKVDGQMSALYQESADWGMIIREVSEKKVKRELQKEELQEQFEDGDEGEKILSLNPSPNISAVAYNVSADDWHPFGAQKMKSNFEEIQLYSSNSDNTLVIAVTKAVFPVSWASTSTISATDWYLYIAYYRKEDRTLFVSCSGDEGQATRFTKLVCDNATKIVGEKTFRILHNINLLKFQNVGLTRGTRDVRFTMHVGRDINSVMDDLENGTAIKSNIFGVGFEEGKKITAGCSYKGKMWEMNSDTIDHWVRWCDSVSKKVNDPNIDTKDILRNVIRSEPIMGRWPEGLFYADWPESIYIENERKVTLVINGESFGLLDLYLGFPDKIREDVLNILILTDDEAGNAKELGFIKVYLHEDSYSVACDNIKMVYQGEQDFADYLEAHPLRLLKQDGSIVLGNYRYYSLQTLNVKLPKRLLSSWEWGNTRINKESMGKEGDLDTVQGFTFLKIRDAYEIIFNDDGNGEIADLVAINEKDDHIQIDFYHCKYCNKHERPGARVDDTYIVSGQASRSVKWQHSGEAIFNQLLYRYSGSLEQNFNRILKGQAERLELLRNKCRDLEVRLGFYIVQPAISETRITDEMLTVLGTSYVYLKNISGSELNVVINK